MNFLMSNFLISEQKEVWCFFSFPLVYDMAISTKKIFSSTTAVDLISPKVTKFVELKIFPEKDWLKVQLTNVFASLN